MSEVQGMIPMVENPATWVADSLSTHCHCCKTEFRLFTRKHHCRSCGLIFCDSCTSDRVRVRGMNGLQRVCFSCYSKVAELTVGEKKAVLEVIQELDETLVMDTLVLKRDRERTKGILVVTNQSILVLERGGGTKQITKRGHLIDMTTINFDKAPHVVHLVFGKLSHQAVSIVVETPAAEVVVRTIRETYRDLTIGLPSEYSLQDDINKFLWMVRIAGSTDPSLSEAPFFTANGEYSMGHDVAPAMKESLMYKTTYYRYNEIMLDREHPSGWDRVRNIEIPHEINLEYIEEAFTTQNWLVRLYKVKDLPNRG